MQDNSELTPIRVLLVEDSLLQLHIIKSILDADPHIEVVGTANNGAEALDVLPRLKPDVICTDYHMPVMDGLEFVKKAVKVFPCPILVLSISVQPDQVDNIFKLLSAGAVDVMPKPRATSGLIGKEDGDKLIERIRILNGVKFIQRNDKITSANISSFSNINQSQLRRSPHPRIIVIGASTGGPQAFEEILPRLKKGFAIPIVCVQHISHGFIAGMLTWLSGLSPLEIRTAVDGDLPLPGFIYFPPEGMHVSFAQNGTFVLSSPSSGDVYCPSIDRLFSSAAEVHRDASAGVLLSGMGKDGAIGIKAIFDAGGHTLAQDEASSIIFGMPSVAIKLGAICSVLSPIEISAHLNSLSSAVRN